VQVVEIPRLTDAKGPISASRVRAALEEGRYRKAEALVPDVTRPFLLAELMARALRMELEAPMKPGLVDPTGTGAHADMDFALMAGSIDTIRRSYVRHRGIGSIVDLGKAVEADVLAYTGGVNTYRGAIFCLILMAESVLRKIPVQTLAAEVEPSLESHGGKAVKAYGVKGALQMAKEGYKELFDSWLPYYRTVKADAFGLQRTLLKIMSELDDTCVIHRVGYERAQQVKAEAKALLDAFSIEGLQEMNRRYAADGISPGGAADMLALTIFIDSILH
jgi:triphosphoribosyl-dephospho-CoA synthase